MKIFIFFLFLTFISPSVCMLRSTPKIFAMHRARSGRPVAPTRQITIHNTEYGIIETLRLRTCPQKDPSNPVIADTKPKLSADHYLQKKHVRVKRKPNTISERRKIYINGKEF